MFADLYGAADVKQRPSIASLPATSLLAQPDLDSDVWSEQERRGLERLAARCRHLLSRAALASADLATGVEAAERSIDADPYDEEALRLAMAGLASQGQSSSALALYERLRHRLDDELGVSPSAETDAAHRAVLKGLPVPGVDVAVHTRGARDARTLIGRDDELRALDALFATVSDGRVPRMVVIDGEPGIGKTALATQWIASLGAETTVFATRCDQVSRALPLQTALHLLRSLLRRTGATAAQGLLGSDASLLEPILDWRASAAGFSPDTAQMLASSSAGIALLFASFGRVLSRACTSASVMFIDDVQRADTLTWDWIGELARTPDLSLLLVLTRRSGDQLTSRGQVQPVDVQRVTRVAVGDAGRSEHAAQPAHDHGDLTRGVTRRFILPEHLGDPPGADRPPGRHRQQPKRGPSLAAAERALAEALDVEAIDDPHAQRFAASAHGP
jgi:AAA ATPase domain/Bacterial transcriptional activator domain